MGNRRRADRGQFEQRLLILVTLGLVAFGLVMVFSATSASATLGEGDPMRFLVKQGLYAVCGLVLLAVLSRVDYHMLRPLAPLLLVIALGLCAAVLVVAPAINGAHRWFLLGPVSLQPAELAKLAVCIWVCAVLARRPRDPLLVHALTGIARRTVERAPADGEPRLILAQVLAIQGAFAEARSELERAERALPGDPRIHQALVVLDQLGRRGGPQPSGAGAGEP